MKNVQVYCNCKITSDFTVVICYININKGRKKIRGKGFMNLKTR
jgi:hypothetical protein